MTDFLIQSLVDIVKEQFHSKDVEYCIKFICCSTNLSNAGRQKVMVRHKSHSQKNYKEKGKKESYAQMARRRSAPIFYLSCSKECSSNICAQLFISNYFLSFCFDATLFMFVIDKIICCCTCDHVLFYWPLNCGMVLIGNSL